MAKIDLILELITSEAQKNLNDFKVKVRSIGDEKIKLNTSDDALDAAKKISTAFDAAKKNAGDTLAVTRNVVASLALAGKSGTKEFTDAKKQLTLAKKEAQEFEKALKKADPTGLGDKFKSLTSGLGGLGIATAAGFGINELIGSFTAFDTATQKIKTLGGEAANLAPQFKTIALEMSKNFPIAAGEIQDSIYEALSAGIDASEQSIKAFSDSAAKLSVGGGETMKNSVNVLSSVLNSYGASAQEAARYSDILFNTVNIGKTTIPELNNSLSQVVPTAASVGVSLDNVGASLAVMTANGMPTSRAANTLNQMLSEMIKPGNEFAAVMQKAGVSLETLKTEGLPVTVEKLKAAMAEMGKTSGAVFGSTDAAAAFAILSKDVGKFKEAFEGVANTTGSTEKAFQYMQESVTAQFDQIKAKIESTFLSIAEGVLPILSTGFDAFSGAVDAVSYILENFGGLVVGATAAVVAYNLAMKISTSDAFASFKTGLTQATTGLTVKTLATKGATLATNALKTAWATNPFGVVLAAITMLIPAITWLSDVLTESTEEKLENAKAAEELTKKQIDETKATLSATEQKKKLVDEYIKLAENSKRTAEEQARFEALQKEITGKYPELITGTGNFTTELGKLKEQTTVTADEITKLSNQVTNLNAALFKQEALTIRASIENAQKELTDTVGDLYSNNLGSIMKGLVNIYVNKIRTANTKAQAEQLKNELQLILAGDKNVITQALNTYKGQLDVGLNSLNLLAKHINEETNKNSSDAQKNIGKVEEIYQSRAAYFALVNKKQEEYNAKQEERRKKEESTYDAILAKIKQYSKDYKNLSDTNRAESEKTLKASISDGFRLEAIDAKQQNALEHQLQKIKETSKESTKANATKKNELLENLKLEENALLKELERNKKIAENKRIAEGRSITLEEEKKDLLDEVAIYEQIRQKLLSLKTKFTTEEAKKEFQEFLKNVEDSVTDVNLEVGTVSAKITVNDADAQKKLLELSKEELEWKLEIATNTGNIQRVIELKEALLDLQKADLYNLSLQLGIAGDDLTKKELELQIAKLQADINQKSIEIGIDYQKLDLEGITDAYEYQFKAGLLEAKLAYEKDLELAQGNIAKKTEAERKYQEERNRLQNEYLEKSLKFSDTLTLASRKFGQTLLESFTKDMNPVEDAIAKLQEQLQNLGKTETDFSSQEKALNESLKNREISVKEYYAKLRELDQKREAETEGRSKTELRIRMGVSSALLETSNIFESKLQQLLQQNSIKSQEKLDSLVKQGKTGTELLAGIIETHTEDLSKYVEYAAMSAASSFSAMLAAGVGFGEAFRKSVLGTLLKTAQQAIMVNIPWIYSTIFAEMGILGYAPAAAVAALLYGMLEAAKSAIGLKTGAVDLAGPGTSTSDSIAAKLSRGESVITADGTKQNIELLKWINKTGRPAYEYFQSVNYAGRNSNQGGVSSQDFDKLSNEVRGMRQQIEILNRRKSTLNAVDVKVKIDDKKLLKLVETDKLAALRRM